MDKGLPGIQQPDEQHTNTDEQDRIISVPYERFSRLVPKAEAPIVDGIADFPTIQLNPDVTSLTSHRGHNKESKILFDKKSPSFAPFTGQ
jgi:hypothetical protein